MNEFRPKLVCFSCNFGWGYLTDEANRSQGADNWIPVACSGKVDSTHILNALRYGAEGVLILGCQHGHCHFQDGNYQTGKKVYLLQRVLEAYGIEKERIQMVFSQDPDGKRIRHLTNEMKSKLIKLGPMKRP